MPLYHQNPDLNQTYCHFKSYDSTVAAAHGDTAYNGYLRYFVRDFDGPYAVQLPKREWATKHGKVSDPLIQSGHLAGKYWIALPSSWYPRFAFIDIDHGGESKWELVKNRLGLDAGEYLLCTSPSFKREGSFHAFFKPVYRGRPMTKKLLQTITQPIARDLGVEIYPQINRVARLPLGKNQFLMSEEKWLPLAQPWSDALPWFDKIDDYDFSERCFDRTSSKKTARLTLGRWPKMDEALELLDHGLQTPSSRYEATKILAQYFYRSSFDPAEAAERLKGWIREKHNGHSKEVRACRWRNIDTQIDDIVAWFYDQFGKGGIYPDTTHNQDGWVTPSDLRFIAEVFPGDLVNQKRLFALVQYCRPRAHHFEIYIGRRNWCEIVDWRAYKKFQGLLEDKGLLTVTHAYRHIEGHPELSYPKRFRIELPKVTSEARLAEDGRAVQEYYAALQKVYGSPRDIRQVTGLSKQTLWNWGREHKAD